MSDDFYELEQLAIQPGTYFNPTTEVVIVVDDSITVGQEVFQEEALEGTEWVRVSDEVPVDEELIEEAVETYQSSRHPGPGAESSETSLDGGGFEDDEDNPELEPDPDDDEEL